VRGMLTVADRVEIAQGLKAGWSLRVIAAHIDRSPSVVSREVRRNWLETVEYRLVHADCAAQARRARPQTGKVAGDQVLQARVLADLGQSRTALRSRAGCVWRPPARPWA
jgi:IS30 family transposase